MEKSEKSYPFDAILSKMSQTLTHQNGDIRKQSQLILIEIYNQFGFEPLKDFASGTN